MNLQILDIILYHHDGRRRVVSLNPGAVNIITGDAKAGKTVLIDIVDYCFGKEECRIPQGPIRKAVAWFALRLQLEKAQAVIARRCPAVQAKSSEECYIRIARTLDVPDFAELFGTANTAALTDQIARWCGITDNLYVPPEGQTRPSLVASIRHAVTFCFQPQDEIIRREQLFSYRLSKGSKSFFLESNIKDTLPYFLGAVDPDYVRKRERFTRLKNEIRQKDRELSEIRAIRGTGQSKAHGLLAEARHVGLTEMATPERLEETFELLRTLALTTIPAISNNVDGVAELDRVTDERRELLVARANLHEQIKVARELARDAQGFQSEAKEQEARLRSIGVFEHVNPSNVCTYCTQPLQGKSIHPSLRAMKATLTLVSDQLASVGQVTPKVEEQIGVLDGQLQKIKERIARNGIELTAVVSAHKQIQRAHGELTNRARVVGRIQLYTESLPDLPSTQTLEEQANRLRREFETLNEELSDDKIRIRIDSILALINQTLTSYGRMIELEHASDGTLRLDLRNLTVIADTPEYPVPMYEMGSGENWVGYHIVAHLALHEWFTRRKRPVPGFLFLDQVSMTGCPSEVDDNGESIIHKSGKMDLEAYQRVFRLISTVVSGAAPNLQVIMLEHLDLSDTAYQAAVVARWRGEKLIPEDWLDPVVPRES